MGTAVFSPSHGCHKPALPFPNKCNSHHGLLLLPNFHAHHRLANARKKRILLQAFRVKCRNEGNFDKESINQEATNESRANNFMRLAAVSRSGGRTQNRLENKLVFVAGATGRVGSRTVRELLKLGYNVRAGTRDVEKAQNMFKPTFFTPIQEKKLQIVECDLEKPETIEPALGNASMVVCCIGASERDSLDVTGPYRIDFKATENLINKAADAQVNHFVLLTSLGTGKIGFPAALLNLFWGVLLWKGKAEQALIDSSLPYTIVRPGGMERPTDMYKETHNLVLAEADTLFGGQVSNLQVAELVASIVANPNISKNKVLEVVAETKAPFRSIEELLAEIPDDGRKESKFLSRSRGQSSYKDFGNGKIENLEEKNSKDRLQDQNMEQDKMKKEVLRIKDQREIKAAIEKEKNAQKAVEEASKEKEELERRSAELRTQARVAALSLRQAKDVEAAAVAAAEKGKVSNLSSSIQNGQTVENKEKDGCQAEVVYHMETEQKLMIQLERERSETGTSTGENKKIGELKRDQSLTIGSVEEASLSREKSATGLLWPWQEPKPAPAIVEPEPQPPTEAIPASFPESPSEVLRGPAPLSPYIMFKDLKPPSTPCPNPPNTFSMPWQKCKHAPIRMEPRKDLSVEPPFEANSLQYPVVSSETGLLTSQRPLSPYFMFLGLKPPLSPMSSPPRLEECQLRSYIQENQVITIKEEDNSGNVVGDKETIEHKSSQQLSVHQISDTTRRERESLEKAKAVTGVSSISEMFINSNSGAEHQSQPLTALSISLSADIIPDENQNKRSTQSLRPLSPYFAFKDLKPPSTPCPNPPNTQLKIIIQETAMHTLEKKMEPRRNYFAESKTGNDSEKDISIQCRSKQEEWKLLVEEIALREKEAVEKARKANAFSWPWHKRKRSPILMEPQKDLSVEPTFEANSIQYPVVSSETGLLTSQRPLSPYFMFLGLKPPLSPMPSLPRLEECQLRSYIQENQAITIKEEHNSGNVVEDKETMEQKSSQQLSVHQISDTTRRERESLEKAKAVTGVSSLSDMFLNSGSEHQSQPLTALSIRLSSDIIPDENQNKGSTQSNRPLSPYFAYPDLRPPCSPTPCPPKLI